MRIQINLLISCEFLSFGKHCKYLSISALNRVSHMRAHVTTCSVFFAFIIIALLD